MKISELYDRDIARRINPAVVVDEMDAYSIDQEINEYIFTPGLTGNMYTYLNAIASKKEGKTGVWINGYYGSGKSHFIKYLYYCLDARYRSKAFENFSNSVGQLDPLDEPSRGSVTSLKSALDKLTVDEIIFNIDAVADNKDSKERITRVLLNRLNTFRGYNDTNIALALYVEKPLDKAGKFKAFKERIKSEFSENWDGNQLRFIRRYLDRVLDIAGEFDPAIDKEALRRSILDQDQDYSIMFLIKELQLFLEDKPADYRLIFLMDEVSQYIGTNGSVLLNLQTIVEEVGSQIGNRVWIVCTAQQDLPTLLGNIDKRIEDFGKIQARFETTISLESQEAAYITKKRVLDKNDTGIGSLNSYYKANKGAIENQFVFDHDHYANYSDREDFTLTYPFVPYQFKLISDVFESFSHVGFFGEGVRNTERAILGITHYTAKLCKDREMGFFVPFDLFFNELLEQYLTHRARGILERAFMIKGVKDDPFAKRVVNALFMVANLGESQRVNFPPVVENLALLLMESADTAKLEMQTRVQEVLGLLANKNILQVSEGKYRFLKEDEIEVAQMISNTTITNDDRLQAIYDQWLKPIIGSNTNPAVGSRNLKVSLKVDDKEIGTRGEFNLIFSVYDHTDIANLAHSVSSDDIVICLSQWFRDDKELQGQIGDYVRTQKYIRLTSSSANKTRTETLGNFGDANARLKDDIQARFERKFPETPIISSNRVIPAGELNGNTPQTRLTEMMKRHLAEIYRKNEMSKGYATSNAELIAHAKSKQKEINKDLTTAEEELQGRLNLEGDAPVVGDIIKVMEKPPYGWKDISTLDVLLHLAKKGRRRFEWRNETVDLQVFTDKALNTRERDALTVRREKSHSQEEIKEFIHTVNHFVFGEILIPSDTADFREAVETFRAKLGPWISRLNQLKDDYEAYPFDTHLKRFYSSLSELYNLRSFDQVAEQLIAAKEQLRTAKDIFRQLEDFLEHNLKGYDQIRDFTRQHRNNFASLDETLQVKASELKTYLETDAEPWDSYPQMKKIFKDLSDAISDRVASLKQQVLQDYERIFQEIADRQKELQTEGAITTSAEFYLQKIKKEGEITQLEIYQLKANDFRAENFKKLEDYKASKEAEKSGKDYVKSIKVTVANEMPPTTIETPEQLESYIDSLRKRLMVILAKNKKIFLN